MSGIRACMNAISGGGKKCININAFVLVIIPTKNNFARIPYGRQIRQKESKNFVLKLLLMIR